MVWRVVCLWPLAGFCVVCWTSSPHDAMTVAYFAAVLQLCVDLLLVGCRAGCQQRVTDLCECGVVKVLWLLHLLLPQHLTVGFGKGCGLLGLLPYLPTDAKGRSCDENATAPSVHYRLDARGAACPSSYCFAILLCHRVGWLAVLSTA